MCMLNAVGSCVVDAQSMLYLLLGDLYGLCSNDNTICASVCVSLYVPIT